MSEHIQLLRQRLQELRDEVRALNEDRQRLQLENASLRGQLRDARAPLSPSLGDDPYWIEAARAGKQHEWA